MAPIVQNASGLDTDDPRCVVRVLGCTGDWTGGWDCTTPKGADAFITEDGHRGRLVVVIRRGEPAIIVCQWCGIYWNGLVVALAAPFECEGFRFFVPLADGAPQGLAQVPSRRKLQAGIWCRENGTALVCLKMAKGKTTVKFAT